jgi:hypothetical protein
MQLKSSTIFSTGQEKASRPKQKQTLDSSVSVTFLLGQERATSGQVTTASADEDSPILVSPGEALGADQTSWLRGTFAAPQPSLGSTTLGDPTKRTYIPGGAKLTPRLRVAVPGSAPRLKTRQLWEGTVTELLDNGFVAVLEDKTNLDNPDEQATFAFDNTELSPDDYRLVRPGAAFYWIIGNERTAGGQVKNVSMVQFRRVPAWTERALKRAADRGRQIREFLWEEA